MNKEKLIVFNTITNILLLLILFFGGFIWADTNGVWHRAEDVQGGVFGSDENALNYTFNNDVYFNSYLRSGIYYIDIDAVTGLNDLRAEKITSNAAQINGNINITGNLVIDLIKNCNGKLITDLNGKVSCGTDNINDADADPNNEKPLSGTGISVSDRTVSVDTSQIATKSYVDSKTSSSTILGVGSTLPASYSYYGYSLTPATLRIINNQIIVYYVHNRPAVGCDYEQTYYCYYDGNSWFSCSFFITPTPCT